MKQGPRKIAKGVSAIPSKTTATLATMTRHDGECVSLSYFVAEPGAAFGADVPDGVFLWLETATPSQFVLKGTNRHKDNSRTVEWCAIGVVPA